MSQVVCSNNVFQNAKINVSTTAATGAVTLGGVEHRDLDDQRCVQQGAGRSATVPPTAASVSLGTNPRNVGSTTPIVLLQRDSGQLSSLVSTLLTSVLPPVLGPVLQTAGASVGGAQVADLSDKCDVVSVVQ